MIAHNYLASRWKPTELVFEAKTPTGTQFDNDFTATFTDPDNADLTIPGFFEGDDRPLVRFAPPQN